MDEFLVGDIITMVENPSPGPIAEAALFTVIRPIKIIDKINDGFKDRKGEQARNKALELVGDLGPNSLPYTSTIKSSAAYGQVVGRQSADGKVRWRLDYDPNKGTHINIEEFRNGKGANARKPLFRLRVTKALINLY